MFLFGHKRILCPKDCPPVLPLTPLLSYILFGPINTSNTARFYMAWALCLCLDVAPILEFRGCIIQTLCTFSLLYRPDLSRTLRIQYFLFLLFPVTHVSDRLIDAMPLLHCGFESGPAPLSHVVLHSLPIFPVCVIYLSQHDKKQTHIHCPLSVPNRSEVQK